MGRFGHMMKRFFYERLILGIVLILFFGGGVKQSQAFTLEEVVDLRKKVNKEFGRSYSRSDAKYSMFFFMNKEKGWVPLTGSLLAQTLNGGLTWKIVNIEELEKKELTRWGYHSSPPEKGVKHGAFFLNENVGWWSVWDKFFRTLDGGKTWERLTLPKTRRRPNSLDTRTIWFANDQEGWVYTHEGSVIYTKDGGLHWEEGRIFNEGRWVFRAMRFLDNRTGYVVGSDALERVKTLPDGHKKGITEWEEGVIFYTHDGGKTWKRPETSLRVFPPKGIIINDVAILSEKEAWVVGSMGEQAWNGTVWHTTDGGTHWKMVVTDVPEYFRSVVSVEQEGEPVILILSQAGKVYRIKVKGNPKRGSS